MFASTQKENRRLITLYLMNLKAVIASLETRLALSGAPFVDPEDPGSLSPAGAQKGAVEAGPVGLGGIGGTPPEDKGKTKLTG